MSYTELEKWWADYIAYQKSWGGILENPYPELLTTWYAERLIDGSIPASKENILAAKRHMRDLKRQGTDDFPWIFDEEKGHRPIRFIEKKCKPSKGDFDQLVLQPWQHFVIGSLFGWVHKDTGIRRFREGLTFVSRKNGKALSLDTPIITPSGWKTMGELTVGDCVYGKDGKPTKVTYTSEIFIDHDCYEVTFEDGEKIIADADHIWTVMTKNSRSASKRKIKRVNSINKEYRKKGGYFNLTTEEMASDFVRVRNDGKGKEYKYRVPMQKPIEFEEKKLLIDPYVLGAWLGDGHSDGARLTLSPDDIELLKHLEEAGAGVKTSTDKRNGNIYASLSNKKRLTHCRRGHLKSENTGSMNKCLACARELDKAKKLGKEIPKYDYRFLTIREQLKQIGVLDNKHIPLDYLRSSVDQRMELLRGLMDTDGYVEKRGQCEFVQKNKTLIDNFSELLSSLGIKHTIREKEARCNGKSAGTVYSVLFYVDKSRSCFKLSRKHNRLKEQLSLRMLNKSIINIKKIETVPTKCIAVDNEDHLYLAGSRMTVTHNTTLLSGTANYMTGFDGERGANVYILANSQKQSSILFDESKAMIKTSPYLDKRFKALRSEIRYDAKNCKMVAMSAEKSDKDGENLHFGVFDELHEYKDYELINVMKKSRGMRRQPLILYITTAGYVLDGPLMQYFENGKECLENLEDNFDERTFYFLAKLDKPEEADQPELWIKANPNIGLMDFVNLVSDWKKERRIPQERADWLTKQFNLFSDVDELSFVDIPTIEKNNKTLDLKELEGKKCVGAYDLSETEDFTAAALEFPLETGEVFILSHSWIPQARYDKDNNQRRLDEWIRAGDLTVIPGDYVNYEYVYEWFVEQSEKYVIDLIAYDHAKALYLNKALENYGFKTEKVRQGFLTLGGPMQNFKEMMLDGKIIFNNSKIFRWYLSNVRLVKDRNSNWMPTKQSANRKIDGFAAALNAHCHVMNMLIEPAGDGNIEFLSVKDLLGG